MSRGGRFKISNRYVYATAGKTGFTVNSNTDKEVTGVFAGDASGGVNVANVVELYPSGAMTVKFNDTGNDAIPLLANTLRVFEDVEVTSIYADDDAGNFTLKVYVQEN